MISLPTHLRRSPRRGFTLLEVLIAMGVSSMLVVAVYFFYMGMVRTGVKSENRLELNQFAEIALERLVRELQLAVEMKELKPDQITFRRPRVDVFKSDSDEGYEVNMNLSTLQFENVVYRRREEDGGKRVKFQRILGLKQPETLFEVDELDKNIFSGWVIPKGSEDSPHEVPDMRLYTPLVASSSDLERIPLIKIRLKMRKERDRIDIVSKAFVPPVYARIIQPNYNKS